MPKTPANKPLPASQTVAHALVRWFREHGRDYPWRRTRDAYAILVSEVMLQQTQIQTVLERGFYERWMVLFPSWQRLAEADETEVLKAWEGLGYYRRARNLQRLAQEVMSRHAGHFPRDAAEIEALPGIGPYTAGAVASFAFGLPRPIVDGNVSRVLARLYNDATPVDSKAGKQEQWRRAGELVTATDDPRSLNSALMELGQTHCRPRRPECPRCPLRALCCATEPEKLPIKSERPQMTEVTERVYFFKNSQGVLLEQEIGSRRTGLWKLPALPAEHSDTPPATLQRSHYGITRYKVTLWVHEAPAVDVLSTANCRLVPYAELDALPMPSPYRRALTALLKQHSQGSFSLEA